MDSSVSEERYGIEAVRVASILIDVADKAGRL